MERQAIVESEKKRRRLNTGLLIALGALVAASPIAVIMEIRREAICRALARGETVLDQPDFTVDTSFAEIQEQCRSRNIPVSLECFAQAMRNTPPDTVVIPPHLRLFGETPHGGSCLHP